MTDVRVAAVKFVYFISGLVIGAAGASFFRASHYGNWTWQQSAIVLAAAFICVVMMFAASRQLDSYLAELRQRH
jgi:hypothetical protein